MANFQTVAAVIITVAGVITAIGVILGVPKKVVAAIKAKKEKKALAEQQNEQQNKDIAELKRESERSKEERCLIIYGLSACLDGLLQLDCNHSVPEAKNKIDKYINQMAHK